MRNRGRLGVTILSTLALTGIVASSVQGSGGNDPPSYALHIAHGKFLGSAWSVVIFGKGGGRCIEATADEGKHGSSNTGVCGIGNGSGGIQPSQPTWEWPLGINTGSGRTRGSILFFLTARRVANLEVQVDPKGREPHWVQIRAHSISKSQALHAHLRHNFGYVVKPVRGNVCITGVVVFNKRGNRIESDLSLPCER